MQLRMIINTILDGRIHCHGMTEDEAMALMTERGFQEDGEAAGKWRRALLSSSQLSTYYVGYVEVSDLIRDLRADHPEWSERELHDTVLGHGSPAVAVSQGADRRLAARRFGAGSRGGPSGPCLGIPSGRGRRRTTAAPP